MTGPESQEGLKHGVFFTPHGRKDTSNKPESQEGLKQRCCTRGPPHSVFRKPESQEGLKLKKRCGRVSSLLPESQEGLKPRNISDAGGSRSRPFCPESQEGLKPLSIARRCTVSRKRPESQEGLKRKFWAPAVRLRHSVRQNLKKG